MDRSQVNAKFRKHNPKPNKVCVGQYLAGFYQAVHDMIQKQEGKLEEKNTAAWAMNMTLLEITTQWCKCPWCKRTGAKIEEFLKEDRKSKTNEEVPSN